MPLWRDALPCDAAVPRARWRLLTCRWPSHAASALVCWGPTAQASRAACLLAPHLQHLTAHAMLCWPCYAMLPLQLPAPLRQQPPPLPTKCCLLGPLLAMFLVCAGKTTTIRMMEGFMRASGGQVGATCAALQGCNALRGPCVA